MDELDKHTQNTLEELARLNPHFEDYTPKKQESLAKRILKFELGLDILQDKSLSRLEIEAKVLSRYSALLADTAGLYVVMSDISTDPKKALLRGLAFFGLARIINGIEYVTVDLYRRFRNRYAGL